MMPLKPGENICGKTSSFLVQLFQVQLITNYSYRLHLIGSASVG